MEAAAFIVSIFSGSEMNISGNTSQLKESSSPFEIYPPLACHIPLDGGDAPTFNYVICAIYSLACLLVVLTGGYFYIQRFGVGKTPFSFTSPSKNVNDGNEVYRPTTLRKSRNTSLLCGLPSI